jgi:hypothetical protein
MTIVNGVMAGWGWIYLIQFSGTTALQGAFAGAMF